MNAYVCVCASAFFSKIPEEILTKLLLFIRFSLVLKIARLKEEREKYCVALSKCRGPTNLENQHLNFGFFVFPISNIGRNNITISVMKVMDMNGFHIIYRI